MMALVKQQKSVEAAEAMAIDSAMVRAARQRRDISSGERRFDRLVDHLALGIVSGRYRAGEVLPNETELGRDLVVSRTAYREAIKFLTAKGLIAAKPRSGTRVRPRTDWNLLDPDILRWSLAGGATVAFVRDLFELRRSIEPHAARLAARRANAEQVMAIRAALSGMETHPPLSRLSIEADIAFHQAIFDATANRAIICLKDIIALTIQWSQEVKRQTGQDEFRRALREHRGIYEAIAEADGERAAALSIKLVDDALRATESAMAGAEGDEVGLAAVSGAAR